MQLAAGTLDELESTYLLLLKESAMLEWRSRDRVLRDFGLAGHSTLGERISLELYLPMLRGRRAAVSGSELDQSQQGRTLSGQEDPLLKCARHCLLRLVPHAR